jgi:hypothetical protein
LDCGSISDGFIRIDGFVGLFSIEILFEQFDNFGNSGRSTDQDNIVNLVLESFKTFSTGGMVYLNIVIQSS